MKIIMIDTNVIKNTLAILFSFVTLLLLTLGNNEKLDFVFLNDVAANIQ